jgi:MFS family permease
MTRPEPLPDGRDDAALAADRRILYAAAFARATATGLVGVELGVYLSVHGLSAAAVGYVVAAGLAGAGLAALVATLIADAHGRRRLLVEVSVAGGAAALVMAAGSAPAVLAAAAFAGMANGMGRDRGAALIVEQAILPATVPDRERTRALARYNVIQDVGHAIGALLAGLPPVLGAALGLAPLTSHRATVGLYGALLLLPIGLYGRLSPRVEAPARRRAPISPASRRILWRIGSLFALDSLGGGFLTTALLSYFFFERFGVREGTVAALFAAARVLNAGSHLGAAWLARRIGLVNTMVFTHVPSSLLLMTVAIVPSFPVAAALFLLREGLVEMDVPTRQSYVLALVRPEERTFASGATNLVRMAMWAVAPALAGVFMERLSLAVPLLIGAALKIAYDLLLCLSFRSLRPPEERSR